LIPMNSGPNTFSDLHSIQDQTSPPELAMREIEGGFPHSEMSGSKPVRGSPNLIAAYHVLHRLSAPRHPPNTLKALDRSHEQCPPFPSARQRRVRRPTGTAANIVRKTSFLLAEHVRTSKRSSWTALRHAVPGWGSPRPEHVPSLRCQRFSFPGTAAVQPDVPSAQKEKTKNRMNLGAAPVARPPGGARRDRTDDLMLAKHALSQLSYGPFRRRPPQRKNTRSWWAWDDSNVRPHPYQGCALTT
jgi:hypothetical protein